MCSITYVLVIEPELCLKKKQRNDLNDVRPALSDLCMDLSKHHN